MRHKLSGHFARKPVLRIAERSGAECIAQNLVFATAGKMHAPQSERSQARARSAGGGRASGSQGASKASDFFAHSADSEQGEQPSRASKASDFFC